MFATELKESTAGAHAALEKKLILHIRNVQSTAGYINLLSMLYGYYHPLEARLAPWLGDDGHERRKSDLIPADIRVLGGGENFPQPCTTLPDIDSFATALGVLYVLEGSTLGGKIIAGMIARQLNLPAGPGFSFFDPYGGKTHEKWNAFSKKLERPFSSIEKEQVVNGANATFLTFKRWVDQYEPANNQ